MKVFLIEPFSYSDDGINVVNCPAGDADVPERFIAGIVERGIGEKLKKAPQNKANKAPKNKAK